ncbi:MAG TPA: NYN domain-containing protein [Steroidobacteraceae bacterium]|nr:NYN domain-containing protein [Steroidobacteraceae bacterium]
MNATTSDATMAVFLDLENIALGARDANYPHFDVEKVLERLLLKGHIVVKKAYCDFDRYKEFKRGLHEAAFELIEIPHVRQSGKNSADIRMVVDALDLCYTKGHVDTFAIISGDSDFSPLVSKLRENAKTVIGIGVKNSSSDLFINNCDEFIYYDDLVRKEPSRRRRSAAPAAAGSFAQGPGAAAQSGSGSPAAGGSGASGASAAAADNKGPDLVEALELVVETLEALAEERGENDPIWGSMIKQAIKRRQPGFNERAHGFRSFNDLLAEAQKRGLLALRPDEKSGGYMVQAVDRPAPRSG